MPLRLIIRGGGDLASGVALRLHRAGLLPILTELRQPLVVRRRVSFASAVYEGEVTVEGVTARRATDLDEALRVQEQGEIPVLADPQAEVIYALHSLPGDPSPIVLIDGRMIKHAPEHDFRVEAGGPVRLVIGMGPGFVAGENCHAVVETNRGHQLGRVIWQGSPEGDTGIPDRVVDRGVERVLRAPADGIFQVHAEIGDHLEAGQVVAEVADQPVTAPFRGVLRGLLYPGVQVWQGLKVGDVDPRGDPRYCSLVSDKSLAVGGGVLEALLSRLDLRPFLWS